MIFRYLLLLVFTVTINIPNKCWAYHFTGIIKSIEDQNPVSYATIIVKETAVGVTCDVEGKFSIVTEIKNPVVLIKRIGYATLETKLMLDQSFKIKYYLTPKPFQLSAITIYPSDKATNLLKDAFKLIPNNYGDSERVGEGFYREVVEDEKQKLLYYGETYLNIVFPGYKRQKNGSIRMIKNQVFKNPIADSLIGTKFYDGPFNIFDEDYVRQKKSFINPKYFSKYSYQIESEEYFDGKKIYNIHFETVDNDTAKNQISGTITIDSLSKAYLKIAFKVIPPTNLFRNDYKYGLQERETAYLYFEGKWCLNYWNFYSEGQNKKSQHKFSTTANYVNIKFKTDNIEMGKPFSVSKVFSDIQTKYDSSYWDNYSIIPVGRWEAKIKDLITKAGNDK